MAVMMARSARPARTGVEWLRGKRILLAEDNITNQLVATQMLDALGATVDVANDGAEALEMLGANAYDLFLIDIEMPKVSGLDVIRAIRASAPPLSAAPVIAVTAYALREHREKITEAGADGLIPKPLLGIEQFGRDIVALATGPRRERGEAPAKVDDGETGPISAPVFDALVEAVGPEAIGELMVKVAADLTSARERLDAALSRSDLGEVGAVSHIVISVAGTVGALQLQALAQQATTLAMADDKAALGVGARVSEAMDPVLVFLRTPRPASRG